MLKHLIGSFVGGLGDETGRGVARIGVRELDRELSRDEEAEKREREIVAARTRIATFTATFALAGIAALLGWYLGTWIVGAVLVGIAIVAGVASVVAPPIARAAAARSERRRHESILDEIERS